jgi:trimeric autotransporter adhesin
MKTVKFFSYLFFILFFQGVYAQNPGGVSANLTYWIKADYSAGKMIFQTGKVKDWENEKSTYKISNGTAAQRPIRYDGSAIDSLNYNPYVEFLSASQTHLFNASTATDFLGTAGTFFIVSNQVGTPAGSRTTLTFYSNTLYRYQAKTAFRSQTSNAVNSRGYVSDFLTSTFTSPFNNARIVTSKNFAANIVSRRNSTEWGMRYGVDSPLFYPNINPGLYLGAHVANSEYFDGKIAEVIMYNTTLSTANIQSIESYLAVKYGVTINHAGLDNTNGYVSSAGTSIYSKGATGTTYWNNIFGLGRDASSGLLQKQSHSYDDSVRLFISTLAATNAANAGTITNDQDFLMMGATTGKLMEAATTAAEKPASVTIRMDREWKLINTSFDQPFTMHIKPAAGASSLFTGGGTLRLMVDDDGDFTNSTLLTTGTSGITITYSSGIITVTIDPASSGGLFPVNGTPKYITIAANSGILAEDLLAFNCARSNMGVVVNWQTKNEINANSFEVEKSTDLINWQVIDIEKSKALNSGGAYYQYIDQSPINPVSYYRIKEVDVNGRIAYSEVRTIKSSQKDIIIQSFPNPAINIINVSWAGFKRPQQIKILSSYGTVQLVPVAINDYRASLDISLLPKGVYMIALVSGSEIVYSKFCKN